MRLALTIVIALSTAAGTWAQDVENLPFHEYDPPSTLVVAEHPLTRARYPFIDVHNHQFGMPDQDLSELTAEMDRLNMAVMVNLSGRGFRRVEQADGTTRYAPRDGDYLQRAVTNASTNAPGRFIVFTNIDVFLT